MLDRLIVAINRHHTLDAKFLATTLGTTPRMVESMIETLICLGKLKRMDLCSSSQCGNCPVTQSCSRSEGKAQIWQVCNYETREDDEGFNFDD